MNALKKLLVVCVAMLAAMSVSAQASKPLNVVLIMADDAGAECFNSYGGTSYKTPNIDALAKRGIKFTAAHSQPICTPTRVKIMTGLSGGRNYVRFEILDPEAYTFGNVMQDHGYKTAVVGKWQLWGRAAQNFAHTGMHPTQAGFDEYLLWNMDRRESRHWNPLLNHNGNYLETTQDDYGPDIIAKHAVDFIERSKDEPFFLYYPMVLPHDPFISTPHSKDIKYKQAKNPKNKADLQQNFADMIAYTDHVVGRIDQALKDNGLSDNTLLIFTCDNGTGTQILSKVGAMSVKGAKGYTIDHGTHVPLIAACGSFIKPGSVCDDLIDFADFFPTIAEATGAKVPEKLALDGRSFLPQLQGEKGNPRRHIYCYYNPRPNMNDWTGSHRFVRNHRFKLYATGQFYDVLADPLEQTPLVEKDMNDLHFRVRDHFQELLNEAPADPPKLVKAKAKKK